MFSNTNPNNVKPIPSPLMELPHAVLQHIFTFTGKPRDLGLTNKQAYLAVNSPAYWRQILQRDFGMPSSYFSYITKNDTPADAIKKYQIVYQRLDHLKTNHNRLYYTLYATLLASCTDFLPLTVTTAPFSLATTDHNLILTYFIEAIRLKNTPLIACILEHVFMKQPDYPQLVSFICIDSIIAAKDTKNIALLKSMHKKCSKKDLLWYNIEATLQEIPYSEHPESKQAPTDKSSTNYFNYLIRDHQFDTAYKLLQSGFVPDFDKLVMPFYKNLPKNIGLHLLGFAETHPPFLHKLTQLIPLETIRLFEFLVTIDNVFIIKKLYAALSHSQLDLTHLLLLREHFLLLAAAGGYWRMIQDVKLNPKDCHDNELISDLLMSAINHGQEYVVQQILTHFGKDRLFEYRIIATIFDCPHKNIVKYLVEDVQLVALAKNKKEIPDHFSDYKSPKQRLLSGLEGWLLSAASVGAVDVLRYLRHEAPQALRPGIYEIPTLSLALLTHDRMSTRHFNDKRGKAIAEYFVEECSYVPTVDDVKVAITENLYDVTFYLLKKSPTVQLGSFRNTEKLCHLLREPISPTRDLFAWLIGPEGRKQGFQFSLLNLTDCIDKNYRDLATIIMASPEFHSLFNQLSNEQEKALIEKIVLLPQSLQELHQNKLPITQMINKTKVGPLVNITAFALALFFQDKFFAKQFLNEENKKLYTAPSWEKLANTRITISAKDALRLNPHAYVEVFRFIHPHMLAWLEKQLNNPMPNAVLDQKLAFFASELQDEHYGSYRSAGIDISSASAKSLRAYLADWLNNCFMQALNDQRECMNQDAQAIAATRSVGLFGSRDMSSHEKIRQLKQDIQQLSQLESKDEDFNKTMKQIHADMASLESQISKSEAGSVNVSSHDLERLQANVNKIKPYLENRARFLV
jgi:hypothetical protein